MLLHDYLISVDYLLDHSDLLARPGLILPLSLLLHANLGLHLGLGLLHDRLLHHDALHLPGFWHGYHLTSLNHLGGETGHRSHPFLRLEHSFLNDSGKGFKHCLLRHVRHLTPHRLTNCTVLVLWVHMTVLMLVLFLSHARLDHVTLYNNIRGYHHGGGHDGHSYSGAGHLLLDFVPEGLLMRIGQRCTASSTPGQLARL